MSEYTKTLQDAPLPKLERPDGSGNDPEDDSKSNLWTQLITSITSIVTSVFGKSTPTYQQPAYYQPTQQSAINPTMIILIAAALMVVFLMREPSGRRR